MSAFGRTSQAVFWGAILWLFVAGLLALQFWPDLPESVLGWVAFIAFGPPLYVLGEAAAEWFWSSRSGRMISDHRSSVVRVLLGVLVLGVACVIVGAVLWLVIGA